MQRANIDDASVYGKELASAMSSQRFTENPWHGQEKTRNKVPHDLWTARHVLVRADKVQPSLEPKYTGPFRVLRRWGKVFRLRLENRDDTVSVDRLCPFYEAERDGGLQQPVPADPEPRHHTVELDPVEWPIPQRERPTRTVRQPERLGY